MEQINDTFAQRTTPNSHQTSSAENALTVFKLKERQPRSPSTKNNDSEEATNFEPSNKPC